MKDSENGQTFYSNVLVYEFEVASSEGDLANAFINYCLFCSSVNYIVLQIDLNESFIIGYTIYSFYFRLGLLYR